jgi:trans-aconitate methyltransferase
MTAPGVPSNYRNSMSAAYEKNMASTSVQVIKNIKKAVSEILPPITANSYILDNACGPGVVTREIKHLYPHAHIVAAEGSPAMLARVREVTIQTPWQMLRLNSWI